MKIKVGILISYDYKFVFDCIKLIYNHVDEIYLAIDKDRLTWSGNNFVIAEGFFQDIDLIDVKNKIKIYEDKFYFSEKTSMENETNERNLLSKKMGNDCWQLQIDADEYFLNFEKLVHFLRDNKIFIKKNDTIPLNLTGKWITLFKQNERGFFYIDNFEGFSFGTNSISKYFFARNCEGQKINTNTFAIHQSWARSTDEVKMKIENWGHNKDFDTKVFFDFWQSIDENNYKDFENFHPVYPHEWKKLSFIECQSINEFIEIYSQKNQKILQKPTKLKFALWLKKFI
jgi:hypothetical protein